MIRPWVFLALLCAVILQHADSAKILCAFPTPSRAQMVVAAPFFEALAEKGHKVTVLSSFPREKPLKNYRDVTVKVDHLLEGQMKSLTKAAGVADGFLSTFTTMTQTGLVAANMSLHSKEFQKIMNTESFDLVIVGIFTNNFLVGLGAHFKCPVIALSTEQQTGATNTLVGNPSAQSSVPNAWLGNVATMDLKHRAKNFFLTIAERIMMTYSHGKNNQFYKSNFPAIKQYPKLDLQLRNISLVLVNDHYTLTVPRPNLPAVVPIAGFHIKPRPDLPVTIKQFMDNAKDGVIYFSLGSNIKTIWLNEPKLKVLLASLGSLKQKVLFKWENATLPNRPKNVMISKWWPQTDILAHNNTKLFITHGGYNSILEAQYFGVPILGIPIYGDQFTNLDVVVHEKWAQVLHLYNFTEPVVTGTIKQMLNNPSYKSIVSQYGERLRDQPNSPLDTAVYWAEYVIRHRGATFLVSPLLKQNFLITNGFDVYILVLVMGFFFFKLSKSFLSIVCKNMQEKYANHEEEANKKKK